jgi:enoyl-CoA hydratase/carnithine racemase
MNTGTGAPTPAPAPAPDGAVRLTIEGPLARITLHRPHVLNAIDEALTEGLESALEAVAGAPEVRVVLLRGAGRAFSSGLDLDMRAAGVPLSFFARQERIRVRLEGLDQITIAALHGYCLGGGLQLAIACDLRVCSSGCQLGLPATLEGLFPGMATVRLPRLIGLGPARRLILSGIPIGAPEAQCLGLVDYVFPEQELEAGIAEVLETYLRVPRLASASAKRLMRRAFEAPLETLEQEMLPLLGACLDSPDAAAATLAWQARRRRKADPARETPMRGDRLD